MHDRYRLYDSAELGELTHQLCCQHLCRDLDGAGEVYPDAVWPAQIAEALRALMHQSNLAREAGRDTLDDAIKNKLIKLFKDGVLVGLSDTTSHADRPGERKARLVLEVLRDREADVLRFAHDLNVPATSNQAERDLRPAKTQQKISGRLTSEQRTTDRYRIRGYLSTAAKHQRKRQLSRVARFDQFSLSGELLRGSAAGYGHAGAAGLGGCSRGRQVALPSRGSWGLRRESCVST